MKVDILAFLISLGSALSWLLLFWTWIGLGRVWRRACFAMVGHGLEGEGLPRDISGFIQSDLRSRPRLTDVQVAALRAQLAGALGAVDQREVEWRRPSWSLRRCLRAVLGPVARSVVRADLERTDALLRVLGAVPRTVSAGAYAMAGGKHFDRDDIVLGLTRALFLGPDEDFEDHLYHIEPLIGDRSELDLLRSAVEQRPPRLRTLGLEAIDRITARLGE